MTLIPAVLLLLSSQVVPTAAQAPAGPARQVAISIERGEGLAQLAAHHLDVISTSEGIVRVIARDRDIEVLDSLGLSYEIEIQNLSAWYAERIANDPGLTMQASTLGQWLSPSFGQGSMGGYYTLSEAESVFAQIEAAFPAIVSTPASIGSSVEGREIWAFTVSDNPGANEGEPKVRMDSLHHGREPMGMHALLWYVLWLTDGYGVDPIATYLVDEREQWFVPIVNPDGYVYNQLTDPGGGGLWRKNRRDNGDGHFGVDLNRNYDYQWGYDNIGSSPSTFSPIYRGPSPASEPEIAAMQAFIGAHSFATALSIHCYANLWLRPFGYDLVDPANLAEYIELSALATEINRYESIAGVEWYLTNGTTLDFDHAVGGSLAWTPEIGGDTDGFWPPPSRIIPLAEENLLALTRTALAAGAYVRASDIQFTDNGDQDGFFEPGETVEVVVTARNSGRSASGTNVIGRLTTSSLDATLSAQDFDFGALGSFEQGDNSSAPFTLTLSGGVAPGTRIPFEVKLDAEGSTFAGGFDLIAGERFPYARDNVELDLGWMAGDASDTATAGFWVQADPIGTNFNGTPASPEDDASLDPGQLCFTTGNGGGSAAFDDVDGGQTTLVSPPFDLSGSTVAYVGYSRWWSNLYIADDALVVEISNDNGQSWTVLEIVDSSREQWEAVDFRVNDFVTPTESMLLRFVATDTGFDSAAEAGIDEIAIDIYEDEPRFNIYGTPEIGTSIAFNLSAEAGAYYIHLVSTGIADVPIAGVTGNFLLDPANLWTVFKGFVPESRFKQHTSEVPNDSDLIGATLYWQSLVVTTNELWMTNRDVMTIF